MQYRSEIDGLRSIAVMSVVLFHFGFPAMSGGFVGVDIFFVISGFLIGGLLWNEQKTTGNLSLLRFYARRIRRLAPAYVVMALVTFAAAWAILLPFEFREFGKGLIAATLYLANVLFFRQSGYFDAAAEEKLFLHTWSLSVEEQFYIVLPFIFLLFIHNSRWAIVGLSALFVGSFIACIVTTPNNPTAVFYLFPFRAWELLAGVLLSIYGRETASNWQYHASLSWFGISLLFGGIMLISPANGFPGYQAGVPVVGTVLILMNGRHPNLINRALSSRVPVAIGLISYSLYLWHWPVLVLSRYFRENYSGPIEATLWVALCLVLGWLSWRFVERPFRQQGRLSWGLVFSVVGGASLVLLGLGAVTYVKDGFPSRFAPEVRVHIEASGDFLQDFSRCRISSSGPFEGVEVCPIGPVGVAPEVLIWGDSHLRAFYEGVALLAQEQGVAGLVIWHAGCPPLFGIQKTETAATTAQDKACNDANKTMRKAMGQIPSIKRILMIGRWAYYAQGSGYGIDSKNEISLLGQGYDVAVTATLAEIIQHFESVYVLRQVPEIPFYDSRVVARRMAHGTYGQGSDLSAATTVSRIDLQDRTQAAEAPFSAMSATKITVIDPWPLLCDRDRCAAIQDGQGMYFDNNHITNTAARRLRRLFLPVFSPSLGGDANEG